MNALFGREAKRPFGRSNRWTSVVQHPNTTCRSGVLLGQWWREPDDCVGAGGGAAGDLGEDVRAQIRVAPMHREQEGGVE